MKLNRPGTRKALTALIWNGGRCSSRFTVSIASAAVFIWLSGLQNSIAEIEPKPATSFTAAANRAVYKTLNFSDQRDFDDARAGFIAGLEPPGYIYSDNPDLNARGFYAWNMGDYFTFMGTDPAPSSVNPSLWRQETLNNINGVFEVIHGSIYQVRGYDLATMSFVRTPPSGWLVIDPLSSRETARAALALFRAHVSLEPIVGIVVTHSHHDHYNGIPGILEAEGGKSIARPGDGGGANTIPFYAPEGFYTEALSENLYLGNSMARRADYMYGSLLPKGERGHIGSGLGKTVGFGKGLLLAPTYEVKANGSMNLNGLSVYFQMAPNTEAPAEMHVFFPDYNAFCPGENISHTMHNLLTSRGAKVRDAKAFAQYIDEAIDLFGPQIEVLIGTHHWPVWGNARCLDMMEKQRDMYRFFNDQVIRMVNEGMNMEEIAEVFELPASLDQEFYNRGYYGTKNHNVKAVYQRYVGWWDGNPANYFKYPDEMAARRYVQFMGGENSVIAKARKSFKEGDYRWVVEVMKHVIFANPDNQRAKELQADAFEQLGYSFESGTWRNIFLSAAEELRNGNLAPPPSTPDAAAIATMPPSLIFDYFSTRVMGKQAERLVLRMRFMFTDANLPESERNLYVVLKNGVLRCKNNKPNEAVDETYQLTRMDLMKMVARPPDNTSFKQFVAQLAPPNNRVWNIVLPLGYDNRRSH